MKKHSLVWIQWRDITSWNGWNDELIEQGMDQPCVFHTVGYLLKKTKDKVTITDSLPGVGNVTVFPAGCIDKIEQIEWKKKPPKQ